jgi:hypothetical protein
MRLQRYINEAEYTLWWDILIKNIKKNCKPYINALKLFSDNNVFYRGYETGSNRNVFIKKTPRKDRKPMNTSIELHNMLDDIFEKKFGWRVRSEGVFTSGNMGDTFGYGDEYVFFPIGKFKYVFSPNVNDLFVDMEHIFSEYEDSHDINYLKSHEYKRDALEEFIDKNYVQNKNLNKALVCREIVWKCKEYYLVRSSSVREKFGDVEKFMKLVKI